MCERRTGHERNHPANARQAKFHAKDLNLLVNSTSSAAEIRSKRQPRTTVATAGPGGSCRLLHSPQ